MKAMHLSPSHEHPALTIKKTIKKKYKYGNWLPTENGGFCVAPYIEGVMPTDEGFFDRLGCEFGDIPPTVVAAWAKQRAEKSRAVAILPADIRTSLLELYDFYAELDQWREHDSNVHGMNTYPEIVESARQNGHFVLEGSVPEGCVARKSDVEEEDESSTEDEDRHDDAQLMPHVYRTYTDDHLAALKRHLTSVRFFFALEKNALLSEYTCGTALRGIAFLDDLIELSKNKE